MSSPDRHKTHDRAPRSARERLPSELAALRFAPFPHCRTIHRLRDRGWGVRLPKRTGEQRVGLTCFRVDEAFDGDRVLPDGALVLVRDELIVGVESGSAAAPSDCEVI